MPTGPTTDEVAVVQAALDDFEGWFDGDAARIERALHPELAKRSIGQLSSDSERLETITRQQMLESTASPPRVRCANLSTSHRCIGSLPVIHEP